MLEFVLPHKETAYEIIDYKNGVVEVFVDSDFYDEVYEEAKEMDEFVSGQPNTAPGEGTIRFNIE
jgi:hypothetical protein